jgi:hypothetical protein
LIITVDLFCGPHTSSTYFYQLAPVIDKDGLTYLGILVDGEITTKMRVEEFWIRSITTAGRTDEGRHWLPFESDVWYLVFEGDYTAAAHSGPYPNESPLCRLRLPYCRDFELIPFIGEDGGKYMHVVVEGEYGREPIQTVKVRGFAIHSIFDPGNLPEETTHERYWRRPFERRYGYKFNELHWKLYASTTKSELPSTYPRL